MLKSTKASTGYSPRTWGVGPRAPGTRLPALDCPRRSTSKPEPSQSAEDGYLQAIDSDVLMSLASDEDALFRLERRPGQYVVKGCPLVTVWPGDRATDALQEQVNAAFVLGHQRTAAEDILFPIHQIVEIALRALSPGINDPFTAITCVDRLGSALHRLAQRDMPSWFRLDEKDRLRVVAPAVTFPEIVTASFGPIRQYARSSAVVTLRLLESITVVAKAAHRPDDRAALRRQAEMIVRGAREALPEEGDRRAVESCFHDACRALGASGPAQSQM